METKTKLIVCLLAVIGAAFYYSIQPSQSTQLYQKWKNDYGIKFNGNEDFYRMNIFMKNVEEINRHNAQPQITYTKGINQFTGLTPEEFEATYLMKFQQPMIIQTSSYQTEKSQKNGPFVDWVQYGAVAPVQNQGSCQASYAFSAIGSIEGFSKIVYKLQQQYSAQQLIDCSQIKGNSGCNTGTMTNSFDYIREYGIFTKGQYPYTGRLDVCSYQAKINSGMIPSKIQFYNTSNTCDGLQSNLINGPVSVAVDGRNFYSYSGGIFSNCSNTLTLAALAVGMNDNYWTVKLSWGVGWGEQGYIRLYRGLSSITKNTCGICNAASRVVS